MDECLLIKRVLAGDAHAERELYEVHVDRVYRLAYRMTGDDDQPQDCTQEAFIRVFDRLADFRGDAAFGAWPHTVATTVVLNTLRKVKRFRTREMQTVTQDQKGVRINQMRGLNASDPAIIRQLANEVHSVVGAKWLEESSWRQMTDSSAPAQLAAGASLVAALRHIPDLLDSYPNRLPDDQVRSILEVAMVGHVLKEARSIRGSKRKVKELRQLTDAGQFSAFFNHLFECETAIYVRNQMHADVEFVAGHHPDVFAAFQVGSTIIRLPIECKRIDPTDPRGLEQDLFTRSLDQRIAADGSLPPLKVIVWLHLRPDGRDVDRVMETVRELAAVAAGGAWVTASDLEGSFQVSVCLLESAGDCTGQPITVTDVPANGSLIVRAQVEHRGSESDSRRLKSVLRVRSDVLPDRIGAFERNLNEAMSQVTESARDSGVGAVAIRIRPPRGLGDLYEADGIVRRRLQETQATHIGLVMLFWNEAERQEGEKQIGEEDSSQREVVLAYHLRPYFISNPAASVRFENIDSRPQFFPRDEYVILRNPENGEVIPTDRAFLEAVKSGPTGSDPQELSEEKDSASLYLKLTAPYGSDLGGQLPGVIRAGRRCFVGFLDEHIQAHLVEFQNDRVARVATLDMRAWIGQEELLFWIEWHADRMTLATPTPDGQGRIIALAVDVRDIFI